MFHVEHRTQQFDGIEEWLGIGLSGEQRAKLLRFELWLEEEAIPAGGVGPGEIDRLFDRHLADSLAFLTGFPGDAVSAIDVGGGVGLPSIPLAIVRPDLAFTLVDRSRRRSDLAARASRILGLTNYSTRTQDVTNVEPEFDVALFRASLAIREAASLLSRCTKPAGTGLFAVSRQADRPDIPSAPEGIIFALSHEGDGILETPFWLLNMQFS